MEDVVATRSAVPPPLPPKTRRPPPPTSFSFPEMSSVKLVSSAQHVVKIRINPEQDIVAPSEDGCIRISVKPDSPYFFYSGQSSPSDTLDSGTCSDLDGSPPPPLPKKTSVAVMGAPVTSPVSTPGKITVTVNGGDAEVGGGYHQRTGSLTSSGAEVDTEEEDDDRISCDSLNSHDADSGVSCDKIAPEPDPPVSMAPPPQSAGGSLPQGLLHDIRERSARLVAAADAAVSKIKPKPLSVPAIVTVEKKPEEPPRPLEKPLPKPPSPTPPPTPQRKSPIVEERTYEDRRREWDDKQQQLARDAAAAQFVRGASFKYEDDRFYSFHLNESASSDDGQTSPPSSVKQQPRRAHDDAPGEEEDFLDDVATFAGVRGIGDVSTIRSSKGTVRGVRNRVRAGIATFLQNHDTKVRL